MPSKQPTPKADISRSLSVKLYSKAKSFLFTRDKVLHFNDKFQLARNKNLNRYTQYRLKICKADLAALKEKRANLSYSEIFRLSLNMCVLQYVIELADYELGGILNSSAMQCKPWSYRAV